MIGDPIKVKGTDFYIKVNLDPVEMGSYCVKLILRHLDGFTLESALDFNK